MWEITTWFQERFSVEPAEDAIPQQVLVYDIARQLEQPLIVASVDDAQCYDRVAHIMMILTLQAYKVRQSLVMGMLQPIQCIEYYLQTGYGESSNYSDKKDNKKQVLCQGNVAAPAAWQILTSLLVNGQKQYKDGINTISPISKKPIKQVGIVYVYETNLWARLEDKDDLLLAMQKIQEGVDRWGDCSKAVGGTLQLPKCI